MHLRGVKSFHQLKKKHEFSCSRVTDRKLFYHNLSRKHYTLMGLILLIVRYKYKEVLTHNCKLH